MKQYISANYSYAVGSGMTRAVYVDAGTDRQWMVLDIITRFGIADAIVLPNDNHTMVEFAFDGRLYTRRWCIAVTKRQVSIAARKFVREIVANGGAA